MKELLVVSIVALVISAAGVIAAVPHMINYQGYLTDTGGEALDTTVAMTFSFYDAATLGTQLWMESQPSIIVQDGLFNVLLGSVNAIPDSVFADTNVWLGITVGGDSEMSPRTRVTSVAYAYRVGTVDGASGGMISGKLNIGLNNTNPGSYAFVAGESNSASGVYAVVSGGFDNNADSSYAAVGGGRSNVAGNWYATVGGGAGNEATDWFSTVGGGQGNEASGRNATVGGGVYNDASASYATVGGGYQSAATASYSTAGGGYSNKASGPAATVAGGRYCRARGDYSVVAGGGGEDAADSNSAIGDYSAIGGGSQNTASGRYAVVSGGFDNKADGSYAMVGGGFSNEASGVLGTVCGGKNNVASGDASTVGGGENNVASGSWGHATVGGGANNVAFGSYATVPGGRGNTAQGPYTFAAGRRAIATYSGCFVWGDATDADIAATNANQIRMRGSGGTWIYSNEIMTSGVTLAAGANAWTAVSDSTKKRNIRLVDTGDILDKVARLPIKQWSYKSQDASNEHIGPMAQDFYNLFHLGEDSLGISTIDPDGIALAAIQELQKQNAELKAENNQLQERLEKVELRLEQLSSSQATSVQQTAFTENHK